MVKSNRAKPGNKPRAAKKTTPKPSKTEQQRPEPLTLKLTIERLDSEGIGVAPYENKTALVQGAFPGETVVAQVEHSGRTHIFTKLQRVLRNAPERTAKITCNKEAACLGCALISMKYAAQLDFKQQRLAAALQQVGLGEDIVIPTVLEAPEPFGYRASAKLVFARKREKVMIGLYQRGSHDVIDCPDCPVHHPLINKIAAIVRDEVQRQKISVYSPQHQNGLLRYLIIRVSPTGNKALVTFVCSHRDLQQVPKLGKWLTRRAPEVIGIHQNVNSSTGNVILGTETYQMHGMPDLIEQVGDIRLRIAPEAFFQVNTRQAARLYAMVREWAGLTRQDYAIDLFCGIGGIALHLGQDAGQVDGIEFVAEAVRNAEENARLNSMAHCRFYAGDAALEFQKLTGGVRQPTLVTVNPPRKGCTEELLRAICQVKPPKLIYVSCDPDTLARDLRLLTAHGFRIKRIQPVDMFPQTAHIETVVELHS